MLPLLIGFVVMGPLSGWLSDRFGARLFSTLGMVIQAVAFFLLTFLPANFDYLWFAILLLVLGIGQGMFAAPNTTAIMNSVPADQRGVASGMRATFQNAATLVSMAAFFSIVIIGLASSLPTALLVGLTQAGLPAQLARAIANLPPTAALFAAFLGYNPMATLLPASVQHSLSAASRAHLLSKSYFPSLISSPFMIGLHAVFYLAAILCLIGAVASMLRGQRYIRDDAAQRAVGTAGSLDEASRSELKDVSHVRR
jgi:MFS family permease